MPSRPPRPCLRLGCPNLVPKGYCPEHQKDRTTDADAGRLSAGERGYGAKWRAARASYLAEHPFCGTCQAEGRTIPASVVDHITPHRGNHKLFWDRGNWQALCKHHHDRKTMTEDVCRDDTGRLLSSKVHRRGA
jgi:5-methylcytosine-specific restriction protein A